MIWKVIYANLKIFRIYVPIEDISCFAPATLGIRLNFVLENYNLVKNEI